MKKRTMKRSIAMGLAVITAAGCLTGCGGSENQASTDANGRYNLKVMTYDYSGNPMKGETGAEIIEKVSGFVGDFTVDIRKKARSVDMDRFEAAEPDISWWWRGYAPDYCNRNKVSCYHQCSKSRCIVGYRRIAAGVSSFEKFQGGSK